MINNRKDIALCGQKIALFGSFKIQVYDHLSGHPRRILCWSKKNQITNEGRTALLTLMCPFGVVDGQLVNSIWSFAVGTNTTPPSIDDTAATVTAVWTSALSFAGGECTVVAVPPNSYHLTISKTLGSGDANGSTLTEAGIFTRGDNVDPLLAAGRKLYARQVHSPVDKVASMTITYLWELGITIQS